jgi:hypothetical protein
MYMFSIWQLKGANYLMIKCKLLLCATLRNTLKRKINSSADVKNEQKIFQGNAK